MLASEKIDERLLSGILNVSKGLDSVIRFSCVSMSASRLGFNRWMQQIGQIVLPVFGSLMFFSGVHSISSPLHLAELASN